MPRSPIFFSAGQCSIPNHPSSTALNLSPFVIFPVVQEPKLNRVSRYRQKCELLGNNPLLILQPLLLLIQPRMLLTSLLMGHTAGSCPACHPSGAPSTFPQRWWQAVSAQAGLLMGVSLCQGQDLLFFPAEHHKVFFRPFLQSVSALPSSISQWNEVSPPNMMHVSLLQGYC